MNAASRPAVLHAACYPVTGPWSVMRDLAVAQEAALHRGAVGLAVITDPTWPAYYRDEIRNTPVAFYESTCPRMFGTATFLYQRIRPPPWRAWIGDLAARARTDRVVVHLHNAWMSGVFLPLPTVPGVRVAIVATFHGVNEHFDGKPVRRCLHRWMGRRLLRHGARLTSVDGLNAGVAERVLNIPRTRFAVIPNGMVPSTTSACPGLQSSSQPLTLGHVGSMIPQKGWQLLAAAAEELNRERVQVRVLLAGKGPDEEAARAWAARHADWAQYLGFVSNPRETVMPRLDVLCLMSQWEGLPMSIVEAMSVGLPVVATDVGGVSEAVAHGETGLLVARSSEALAEALRGLLSHRDRLAAMQAASRARFEERFTLAHVLRQYDAVYQEALA